MILVALLALACRRKQAEMPDLPPPPPAAPAPPAAGRIADDRYQDDRYPLSIAVLPGWEAEPWAEGGPRRAQLTHAATGTRLEIWIFDGPLSEPAPRGDCLWTFVDRGAYRALPVTGPVLVGTCVPEGALDPRIFAWLVPLAGSTAQLELHVPPRWLHEGYAAGEDLLRTLSRE